MPLSEEELRLLEQMERALVQEDPKLASTLRGTTLRQSARRRAMLAGIVFAVGVAVLIAGAYFTLTILGIAGFVIMLGSATMALTSLRGSSAPSESARPGADTAGKGGFTVIEGGRSKRRTPRLRGHGQAAAPSGSFMERMEERWRRRRDERGGL